MALIDFDVEAIVNQAIANKYVDVEVIIKNKVKDFQIDEKFLEFIEFDRDYMRNKTDFIRLGFQCYGGDFIKDIYNERNNLEVILNYTNIFYNKENKPERITVSRTYKAIIIGSDGGSANPQYTKTTPDTLNKGSMTIVTLQLVDRIYEVLRPIPIELQRRHATMTDVLRTHVPQVISDKEVMIEDEPIELIVDVVPSHNLEEYDNIRYEQEDGKDVERLLRFGNFLQETYGVYNSGLGSFIQHYKDKDILFYYPFCDITRYNKEKDKLEIYIPTSDHISKGEKTFIRDGDVLKIIVDPSNIEDWNNGDKTLLEKGNAVGGLDPNLALSGMGYSGGASVISNSTENLMTASAVRNLEDGNNTTLFVGSEGNLYKHRSNIIINSLIIFNFVWQFSNPDEIFPGMPVKVIQEVSYNNKTEETGPYLQEYIGSVVTTFSALDLKRKSMVTKVGVMVNRPRPLS